MGMEFAPRIEFAVIGKIGDAPHSTLVVQLETQSLSRWRDFHHFMLASEAAKLAFLMRVARDLLPQIKAVNAQRKHRQREASERVLREWEATINLKRHTE